jgi:hypothetical protein
MDGTNGTWLTIGDAASSVLADVMLRRVTNERAAARRGIERAARCGVGDAEGDEMPSLSSPAGSASLAKNRRCEPAASSNASNTDITTDLAERSPALTSGAGLLRPDGARHR